MVGDEQCLPENRLAVAVRDFCKTINTRIPNQNPHAANRPDAYSSPKPKAAKCSIEIDVRELSFQQFQNMFS